MKKQKSIPKLKAELQLLVNQFVRLRDAELPCISCGNSHPNKQAGHFFAISGYDGLRFDLFNINGECPRCNCFDESHLIGYTDNLKERIGEAEFNLLKLRAADYKRNGYKFTRSELEGKIIAFKFKIKEITN